MIGAPRVIRTPTDRGLNPVPLPLGYWRKLASWVRVELTQPTFVASVPYSAGQEKIGCGRETCTHLCRLMRPARNYLRSARKIGTLGQI